MSTEARIGVVAGLFIVVVTSVYFFYGQSSKMDDLLVTSTGAKVAPPKIPAAGDSPKPAAPATTPPTALANQQTPAAPPTGAAAVPTARDHSIPTVGTERVASATNPLNAPGSTPSGVSKPAANDTGPTFGLARGAPPRIGGETPAPAAATGDDLAPTTWDHLSQSKDKSAERIAPGGNSSPASEDLPALAVGGPDRRPDAKPLSAAGPDQTPPRDAAHSRAADARPAGKSTNVDIKPGSAPSAWPKQHKIVSGDTLIGLAFAYYEDTSRVDAILAANPQIKNPRGLKIGQVVTIPAPSGEQAPPIRTAAAPRSESSGLVTLTGRTATPHESAKTDSPAKPAAVRTYIVLEGDTFYSIAAKLYGDGNKWRTLYDANKSTVKNDPKRLRTGMTLTVPAPDAQRP